MVDGLKKVIKEENKHAFNGVYLGNEPILAEMSPVCSVYALYNIM
jgi:hypothetical protein